MKRAQEKFLHKFGQHDELSRGFQSYYLLWKMFCFLLQIQSRWRRTISIQYCRISVWTLQNYQTGVEIFLMKRTALRCIIKVYLSEVQLIVFFWQGKIVRSYSHKKEKYKAQVIKYAIWIQKTRMTVIEKDNFISDMSSLFTLVTQFTMRMFWTLFRRWSDKQVRVTWNSQTPPIKWR